MRSENSVKNSLFAIGGQTVSLIFGFVTRREFIRILGEAYLGLNGVFYSVLSLLSLTELGLGSAITYALYRPIAEHDDEQTGRIMNLYALAYRIVALAVTLLGLGLVPFLGIITRDVPEIPHVTVIYLLFLANSAGSYLFSYRRALITAAELDRRNTLNQALFSVLQNILQLILLIVTESYILYLVAQLVCTLLSNLEISYAARTLFPEVTAAKGLPDKATTASIAKNVKAMFISRFGSIAVTGTDNLLIASIGIALAGLYSNYLLLLQTIQTILTQVMNAVTASVGNLIATDESDKRRSVYRDVILAASWLYGFSAIALDLLMTRFITLFFGTGLEIPELAVHMMCINFYLAGIRQPNLMYVSAAGLFEPVKLRGFVEAAVNLGASLLFMKLGLGLFGVLLGTTVSHLFVSLGWETMAVSKHCLHGSGRDFTLMNLACAGATLAAYVLTRLATGFLPSGAVGFCGAVLLCALVPNLVLLACYAKTRELAFFAGIAKRTLARFVCAR